MFLLAPSDLMHDVPQGTIKHLVKVFTRAVYTHAEIPPGFQRKKYFQTVIATKVNAGLHSWGRYAFPGLDLYCSENISFFQAEMPNSNRLSLAVYILLLLVSPSVKAWLPQKGLREALVLAFYNQLEQYFVFRTRILPTAFLNTGREGETLGREYLRLLISSSLATFQCLLVPPGENGTSVSRKFYVRWCLAVCLSSRFCPSWF